MSPRDAAPARRWTGPAGWTTAVPGVVLGAVNALIGLDRRPLWLDEAYTLGAVHQLGETVRATGATMAAYYALLRGWLVVSESVAWMRGLSVVLALLALVVTVRVARLLLGDGRATAVGVVLAVSPMWLAYAQEARSYALVMLLVALSWLALVHGLDDEVGATTGPRWWWLHLACAAALPLAHGLGALQVLVQLAVVAAARPGRAVVARMARSLVATAAATGALLSIGAEEVGDWAPPVSLESLGFLVERFTSPVVGISVAVCALAVVGAFASLRRAASTDDATARVRSLVPVVWALGPLVLVVAVSVVRPSLVARYVVGAAPGLALLLVVGIDAVVRARPRARAALVVVMVLALLVGRVDRHAATVGDWRMAASVVAEHARPGDTLLLANQGTTRPPFEAAWREVTPPAPVALVPSDRPLGEVLRFEPREVTTTERWAEARTAGRLWVVGTEERRELDRLPHLTEGWGSRPPTHREVERWVDERGEVTVVLLEPLGA